MRRLLGPLLALLLAVSVLGSGTASAQEGDGATAPEQATARAAAGPKVLILGDSVLEGICRFAPHELNRLRQTFTPTCDGLDVPPFHFTQRDGPRLIRQHANDFDDYLVLVLGYNDLSSASFQAGAEAIMQMPEVRAVPNVFWLNLRNVNGNYTVHNQVLASLDARYANLSLVDWHGVSVAEPRVMTGSDGIHLTAAGSNAMANLITDTLNAALNPKQQCRPPSGIHRKPSNASARGYYLLDSSGKVHAFPNNQGNFGDVRGKGAPVSMQTTPSGNGYWIVTADGRVHAFGDAQDYGDMPRNFPGTVLVGPVRRIEPNPKGGGYWLMASDGGIFTFGPRTRFLGSVPGVLGGVTPFGETISITATTTGRGYFLVGDDGGVFTFGDARFLGSVYNKLPPGRTLDSPIEALAVDPRGRGYWLYAGDGGIFTFGNVNFFGSVPGLGLCRLPTTVAMRPTETGNGYWVTTDRGWVIPFGDAKNYGGDPQLAPGVRVIDMAVRGRP